MDLIVEGKKSFWIDGMGGDSNAQVYLILSKRVTEKKKKKKKKKRSIIIHIKLELKRG